MIMVTNAEAAAGANNGRPQPPKLGPRFLTVRPDTARGEEGASALRMTSTLKGAGPAVEVSGSKSPRPPSSVLEWKRESAQPVSPRAVTKHFVYRDPTVQGKNLGNAYTDPHEMVKCLRRRFDSRPFKEFKAMFISLDSQIPDAAGLLSRTEIVRGLGSVFPGATEQQLNQVFDMMNPADARDKTPNHISMREFVSFLRQPAEKADPRDPVYIRDPKTRRMSVPPQTVSYYTDLGFSMLTEQAKKLGVLGALRQLAGNEHGDGHISINEFQEGLKRFQVGFDKRLVLHMVDKLDPHSSGVIDMRDIRNVIQNNLDAEHKPVSTFGAPPAGARTSGNAVTLLEDDTHVQWLQGVAQRHGTQIGKLPTTGKDAAALFRKLDKAQTGFVPRSDLREYLQKLGTGDDFAQQWNAEADRLVALCDTNNDGYVDLRDLRHAMQVVQVACVSGFGWDTHVRGQASVDQETGDLAVKAYTPSLAESQAPGRVTMEALVSPRYIARGMKDQVGGVLFGGRHVAAIPGGVMPTDSAVSPRRVFEIATPSRPVSRPGQAVLAELHFRGVSGPVVTRTGNSPRWRDTTSVVKPVPSSALHQGDQAASRYLSAYNAMSARLGEAAPAAEKAYGRMVSDITANAFEPAIVKRT